MADGAAGALVGDKMPYRDKERERQRLRERQATPEHKAYQKAYHASHKNDPKYRERMSKKQKRNRNPEKRRAYDLKIDYGMTVDEYEVMRIVQNYRCAICGKNEEAERYGKLHIDHDHETGKVRGLLCTACNHGLGRFEDSPERLEIAADYLRRTL